MARFWHVLRSRRLASYLLIYLTFFFWIGTLLPFGGPESDAVKRWAAENPVLNRLVEPLGLHDPYTTVWFLVPALWLTLSTCACAVERTRSALDALKTRWALRASERRRLDSAPDVRFRAMSDDADVVLAKAEQGLASLGMRSRRGPTAVVANSRLIGLGGSPLFHVALGLLFVFATLGWLTRWEGGFFALRDRPIVEVQSSYLPGSSRGLLSGGGFTGYTFTVTDVIPDYAVDGTPIGSAARLLIRDGERTVAEGVVRTNRPIRFGSTMVHHLNGRVGSALVFTIAATSTAEPIEGEAIFQANPSDPADANIWTAELSLPDGGALPLTMRPRRGNAVAVTLGSYGDMPERTVLLKQGDTTPLPGGGVLKIARLTRFAELTVVHDWSVPLLYLMFALASVGSAVTIFLPHRRVMLVVSTYGEDGLALACLVRAQKIDPAFSLMVTTALEAHGFERID